MAGLNRITDPSLLSEIPSVGTSKLPDLASPTYKATLVLLQPLADANTLATCRKTDSRLHQELNRAVRGTSNPEHLDIRALSKAWRQAVAKVEPISDLTFDLTLPKGDESTGTFQKVYWEVATPNRWCLAVLTRDVMNIVITIATEMRMRVGGELRLGLIYDETERGTNKKMKILEKQLLALAEYKASTVQTPSQPP